MLYKNIMVAFDGSDPAKEALVVAKNLIGDDSQATMHIVSVVSIGSLGLSGDLANSPTPGMQQIFPDMKAYDEAIDNAKKIACDQMRETASNLVDSVECNVTFDATVAVKPAAGICDYAEDHEVEHDRDGTPRAGCASRHAGQRQLCGAARNQHSCGDRKIRYFGLPAEVLPDAARTPLFIPWSFFSLAFQAYCE